MESPSVTISSPPPKKEKVLDPAALERELNEYKELKTHLEGENSILKQELAKNRQKIEKLQAQEAKRVEQLKIALAKLENHSKLKDQITKERDSLRESYMEVKETAERLQAERNAWEEDLRKTKHQLNLYEQQFHEMNVAVEGVQQEAEIREQKMNQKYQEMKAQLEGALKAKQEMKEQLDIESTAKEKLAQEIAQIQIQLKNLTLDKELAEQKVEQERLRAERLSTQLEEVRRDQLSGSQNRDVEGSRESDRFHRAASADWTMLTRWRDTLEEVDTRKLVVISTVILLLFFWLVLGR